MKGISYITNGQNRRAAVVIDLKAIKKHSEGVQDFRAQNAVLAVAGSGRFLPFDKDRRWFDGKDERVLVGEVTHLPGLTVVPTLTGRGLVKVHHYAGDRPDLAEMAELAEKLCSSYGAERHRTVWRSGVAVRP